MTPAVSSQSGLFAQLEPLLTHRAVLITVSQLDGDQLQVNICPRQLKEGENSALTIPLSVTGTAAELDADLVPQISRFVASHIGLNSNLKSIEQEIEEAEKTAREEAKKKQKAVGNGGKKVTDSASTTLAQPVSKPEMEPQKMLGLFDQESRPVDGEAIPAAVQSTAHTD
jgi:PRTRC genetic system protein E